MKERVSQGKIFRHETAKQKHLIYQRSISSKKISLVTFPLSRTAIRMFLPLENLLFSFQKTRKPCQR